MRRRLLLTSVIIVWAAFVVVTGLTYYVNHRMPRGPFYATDEYTDPDFGRPREIYVEDLRGLRIPDWAKFLRKSDGKLLWIGLLLGGLLLTSRLVYGNREGR